MSELKILEGLKVHGDLKPTGAIYDSNDSPGTSGQLLQSTATGTDWVDATGISAGDAEAVRIAVKNTSGATITKGTPVYITGNVGNSDRLEVAPADASDASKMPAVGLLESDLANNAEGYVAQGGYLKGLSTATIDGTSTSSNDTVYVKAGGGLTMTKPTGTNYIQNVAKVARVHASSGSLVVSSILRTNDVPTPLYIDHANQRLGIGTSSPEDSLHIDGGNIQVSTENSGEKSFAFFEESNGGTGATFGYDGGDNSLFIGTTANNNTTISKHIVIPRSTGNVGIGTTSPRYTLHSFGSGNHKALMLQGGGSANEYAELGFIASTGTGTDANLYIRGHRGSDGTFAGSYLTLGTNNTERMRIDSSGRVGVGTDDPYHKVDIYSNSNVPLRIHRPQNTNLNSSGAWGIGFSTRGDTTRSTTDTRAGVFSYYNGGLFLATGSSSIISDPDSFARININNAGNVGIGTGVTAPDVKLHVKGEGYISHFESTNASTQLRLTNSTSQQRIVAGDGNLQLIADAASQRSGSHIDFIIDSTTASKMRLDTTGLGIGTTSPKSILELSGTNPVLNFKDTGGATDQKYFYLQGAGDKFYISSANDAYNTFTSHVTIDRNSNVGIGTTSPDHALNISTANDTTALGIDIGSNASFDFSANSTSGYTATFNIDDTGLDIGHNSTGRALNLKTGSQDRLTILGGGNVGIGTTSPGALLTVRKDGTQATGVSTTYQIQTVSASNGGIAVQAGSESKAYIVFGDQGDYDAGRIAYTNSTNSLGLYTSNSEKLTILSGGSVGINQTGPNTVNKLEVNGQTRVVGGFMAGDASAGNTVATGVQVHLKNTGAAKLRLEDSDSENLAFDLVVNDGAGFSIVETVGGDSGDDTRFFIEETTGDIGIGTEGPTSRLTVYDSAGTATTLANSVDRSAIYINADSANGSNNLRIGESGSGAYFLQVSNSAGTTPYAIHLNPFGGNVAVGTTTASRKLAVAGAIELTVADTTLHTAHAAIRRGSGGEMFLDAPGHISVTIDTNNNNTDRYFNVRKDSGSELFRVQENGQVFVDTTSSQTTASFAVRKNGGNVEFGHENMSSGYYGQLGAMYNSGNPYISFSCDNDGTIGGNNFRTRGFKGNVISGTTAGDLVFSQATNASSTSQGLTERMRINSSGNVGVNTTSPHSGTRMQICGSDTTPSLNTTAIDDTSLVISNSDDDYGMVFATDGSGKGYIQQRRTATATYYDLLLQPHGGSVGINTTSPGAKLDVQPASNGKITKFGNDVMTQYTMTGLSNHTLTLTCGSYYQAEVIITANQTNGGEYNNLYIRGIWHNNHESHHWEEIEHIGLLSGSSFTITVSQNTTSNSGKLVIQHNYSSASFAQAVIRVTDFYNTHSYTLT